MGSQLNSANDDLVLNATGGSDLVFQQDGVEKGRVGAGGFGKVLQVVQGTTTTQFQSTASAYVDVGITASITPKSTTSKILISYSTHGDTNTGNENIYTTIYKNGVDISPLAEITQTFSAGGRIVLYIGSQYLDSPNTTSPLVYSVYAKGDGTWRLPYSDRLGQITLMEIGA